MPHWSRNGHELVYQSGDQILTASYSVKGDTFSADKPRVWIARYEETQRKPISLGRRRGFFQKVFDYFA